MVMLVTLEEASAQVRRDSDDDDADLTLKIKAASGAVLNYLKSASPYIPETDGSGNIILDSAGDVVYLEDTAGDFLVKDEVKLAVLYLTGIFYRDRDGQDTASWTPGYLPAPVTSLLYPLRDPAME